MTRKEWFSMTAKCRYRFRKFEHDPAKKAVFGELQKDLWLYRHGDRSDTLFECMERICGRGAA